MNKSLLAIALFSAFPLYATEAVNQPDAALVQPPQVYLDQAITLQHTAQIAEGRLASANQYAAGDKVHAVANALGITLYKIDATGRSILSEVSYSQLGLDPYFSTDQLIVSPDDKWVILKSYNTIISLPLDAQFQPMLNELSTFEHYGHRKLKSSGNLLVDIDYTSVTTFRVDATSGKLSRLNSFEMPLYSDNWAVTADTLFVGTQSQPDQPTNLTVYRLRSEQWQPVAEHQLAGDPYLYVGYLAVNPQGTRVLYGNTETNVTLDFVNDTLTPVVTNFPHTYSDLASSTFIDDNTLIAFEHNRIVKYNLQTKQADAVYNLEFYYDASYNSHVSAQGISFLSQQSIVRLNTNLQPESVLKAGDLDDVFQFDTFGMPQKLGDTHLLSVSGNGIVRLFKFDAEGKPLLVQSEAIYTLLGWQNYQQNININALHSTDNTYLISQSNRYAVVKLNTNTDKLEYIAGDYLQSPLHGYMPADSNRTVVLGQNVVIAYDDTLNVFELNESNQLQFISAVKNNISGISGIANIDMILSRDGYIYTINNYQQTISQFALSSNALQQVAVFEDLTFASANLTKQSGDFLTLITNNLMQVFQFDAAGNLKPHSVQYLQLEPHNTLNLGQRFLAAADWEKVHLIEQDLATGNWHSGLMMPRHILQQDFGIESLSLVPGMNSLMMYDNSQNKLHIFSHNSAPYVTDATKLALQFNQGQSTTLSLADVIKDEEDAQLTYTLQAATPAFSMTDDGALSFNGEQASAGQFDVLVQDPAQLASQVRFSYNLNLAPVLKAGAPSLNAEEDKSFYFDLASYFTDPEGMAVRYSLTSPHAGISLTDSGILAGTFADAGEQTLNFTVTDSAGATASYSVTATIAAKPDSGGSMPIWLTVTLAGLAYRRRSKH